MARFQRRFSRLDNTRQIKATPQKFKQKGSTTPQKELDYYCTKLKPQVLIETETSTEQTTDFNRYCIYCKKGNSRKIVNCRMSTCSNTHMKYRTETIEKD
jgi:hypothetical protein